MADALVSIQLRLLAAKAGMIAARSAASPEVWSAAMGLASDLSDLATELSDDPNVGITGRTVVSSP